MEKNLKNYEDIEKKYLVFEWKKETSVFFNKMDEALEAKEAWGGIVIVHQVYGYKQK